MKRGLNASLLLRRIHLYLGLILMPWLVMYAVSTILMNHGLTTDREPTAANDERSSFTAASFLARMHRKTGSDADSFREHAWGISVDLVTVATIFWVLSGFWMLFEIRSVRFAGLFLAALGFIGLILFILKFR